MMSALEGFHCIYAKGKHEIQPAILVNRAFPINTSKFYTIIISIMNKHLISTVLFSASMKHQHIAPPPLPRKKSLYLHVLSRVSNTHTGPARGKIAGDRGIILLIF